MGAEVRGPAPGAARPAVRHGSGARGRAKRLERKREAVASFLEFSRGGARPAWPLEIYLEVSNVCDLRCVMCPRFSGLNPARKQAVWDVDPGFLETNATGKAMDELLDRALAVHAFGYGEPTIHPNFESFLEHLAQYDVMVDFFTNGMHLTERLARRLVELFVHHITVSFSGSSAEEYENVYQGGKFEQVLAGLERIRDARRAAGSVFPRIHINSLAFDHHLRTLDRFVEIMGERGVDRVEVTRLLEHNALLPALRGHAADPRSPEVRRAVARARALAENGPVELVIHPDIASALEAPAGEAPSAPAGRIPVAEFLKIARELPVLPPDGAAPSLPVVSPDETPDEVRRRLEVRKVPPAPGLSPFYCLEPFKTFYLRRGGQVKTCCYMRDDSPALGDIAAARGREIWDGTVYEVVRGAILNGQYPLTMCSSCLAGRQAPPSHGVDQFLRDYGEWNGQARGAPFDEDTAAELAKVDGEEIVRRLFDVRDTAFAAPGSDGHVRQLLALVAGTDRLDGSWSGVLEGFVDHVSEAGVAGWVHSPVFPDARFPVTLWAGERKVAERIASQYRPDLILSGRGNGRYGFSFAPVEGVSGAGLSALRVELGGTGCALERVASAELAGGRAPRDAAAERRRRRSRRRRALRVRAAMGVAGGWER